MNRHLQKIHDFIQQAATLSAEDKTALAKAVKDADTEITITEFKLDRTEKVKRTTAILLEETIEELESKRKTVEEKNHDLEIEASLERVRTVAMSMHKAGDLLNICKSVYNELQLLAFTDLRNAIIHTYDGDGNYFIDYDYSNFTKGHVSHIPYSGNSIIEKFVRDIRKAKDAFSEVEITAPDLNTWKTFRDANNEVPDERLNNANALYYYIYAVGDASIGISTFSPIGAGKLEIIKRFRNVFDLAYSRYNDISKAEAQARDAQIEAALERVRSRTMGMQKSDELAETSSVLFQQIKELGFETWSCGFCIWKEDDLVEAWMGADSGGLLPPMMLPYKQEPTHRKIYESFVAGELIHEHIWEGDELAAHYTFMKTIPSIKAALDVLDEAGLQLPGKQCYNVGFFKQGYLLIITKEPYIELKQLGNRLASVFEQTFTRFLDLQKAEAQAREAQIEAALERVRSKTMAMHNSNDVGDAMATMFDQILMLGIDATTRCGVGIIDKTKHMQVWTAYNDDGSVGLITGRINMTSHAMLHGVYNSWEKREIHSSYFLHGEDEKAYYRAINHSDYDAHFKLNELPSKQYQNAFYFPEGFVYVFSPEQLAADTVAIFKRFAGVFGLTYRRFLDLQRAEAQAREAQIEAGLERVRSRTMAMQTSDELAETAAVVFKQLIGLGIEPNRLFIGIVQDDGSGDIELWATDEDGSKVSTRFTGNINDNASVRKMYDGWKAQKSSTTIDMRGKELKEYFHYLAGELKVPFKLGLSQKRRIQSIAYFSEGFIGMASPDEQPAETLKLLERFAGVFNLTFVRFHDLKVAEAHAIQAEQDLVLLQTEKKRAEDALSELKATQTQLIQSEKMASLGELTAGIAHEIQNPLNFVNNFSEVNTELIDEMREELAKGDLEEVMAIAANIKDNQQKILHHGKRAGDIVKGMLQHSRASSKIKEPTNINKLADEYLRLAYHGLRAKDKSFNAELITNFDENLPLVSVVPQDMGRVFLNMLTNAFYAVQQKQKTAGDDYKPTVTVTTFSQLAGGCGVTVKDNGEGIPDSIKEKIMQPFFTTKPTGEGTGLGLSLSYDIVVKMHDGKIDVHSVPGEGSEFTILLPRVTTVTPVS